MKKVLLSFVIALCLFGNMTTVFAEETNIETTEDVIERIPIPDSIKASDSVMGTSLQPIPPYIYVTRSYNGHNYAGNISFDHMVEYNGIWIAYYEGYIYLVA